MEKEKVNQIDMDYITKNEKVNRLEKMGITDILILLSGVATVGIVTLVLAWIIL